MEAMHGAPFSQTAYSSEALMMETPDATSLLMDLIKAVRKKHYHGRREVGRILTDC